jgi:hypothetical protein
LNVAKVNPPFNQSKPECSAILINEGYGTWEETKKQFENGEARE